MVQITKTLLFVSRTCIMVLLSCVALVIFSLLIGHARHFSVISFTSAQGNGDYHLYLMDIYLGRTHQFSTSIFCCHAWSPDGQEIIFVQSHPHGATLNKRLYLMNGDGSDLRPLTLASAPDSLFPTWSPDGKSIVYVRVPFPQDTEIAVLDVQTGATQELTRNNQDDDSPQWSSDGHFIVFRSQLEAGIWDIYRVNLQGKDVQKLTNSDSNNLSPSISPDSRLIAFISDRSGNQDLYVMNADGTNLQQLTWTPEAEMTPIWSPDGTRILFQAQGTAFTHIYVIDAEGRNKQQLITDTVPTLFSAALWSPDSEYFLFRSKNALKAAEISLMSIYEVRQHRLRNNIQPVVDLAWQP